MSLKISVSKEELIHLTNHQLSIFLWNNTVEPYVEDTLNRIEKCFSGVISEYYHPEENEKISIFSPYQSGQYAQYLYYLANTAYKAGNDILAEKVYYLNKMLNGVEWYYKVELPDIFYADHPIGCVLGRAKYSNFFLASQGCTVGNNHGIYPFFNEYVVLHPYSSVLGRCSIGKNVEISAYAMIRDEDIPDNSIVFGQSPSLKIVRKSEEEMIKRIEWFVRKH